MIRILGRTFETYDKAITFLKLSIKMESNDKIRVQLEHKLGYLEVERDIAADKAKEKARAKRK
jgi:hypothetical protein